MPLGTPNLSDSVAHAQGGTISQLTNAQLITAYGSTNTFTPSSNFSYPWNGQVVHFTKNIAQHIDVALKTKLVAAGLGS